jgi:hypothetical protein
LSNLSQFYRAHNLTFAKLHGLENYESERNITDTFTTTSLLRATNALGMLMNRLKNIEKYIETFDPLCGDRLLLDENLTSVKNPHNDYQVILPEQFQERAVDVEQFAMLYTKTILAVKRLIIQVDPHLKSP